LYKYFSDEKSEKQKKKNYNGRIYYREMFRSSKNVKIFYGPLQKVEELRFSLAQ